jgi:hypothetical protein
MLAGIGLLAAISVTACAAHPAGNVAGPPSSPARTGAASPAGTGAASPTATPAVSPSAATPTAAPTGPGGVQNLVMSSALLNELTAVYVAARNISLSDISGGGPLPGEAYYAYDPATDTYWALANFAPSSTAPWNIQESFQYGGKTGMYRKAGAAGTWQIGVPGNPYLCGELQWYPQNVLITWALPTALPAGQCCITC